MYIYNTVHMIAIVLIYVQLTDHVIANIIYMISIIYIYIYIIIIEITIMVKITRGLKRVFQGVLY